MQTVQQKLSTASQAEAQGDLAQALRLYQEVLQQFPNELGLHIACGNLCVALSQFQVATSHFRYIYRQQASTDALNALCYALQGLGNQAQESGQYALAETCFAEMVQYQPRNAIAWYNLGNAQREQHQLNAALHSYRQSLAIDANDADAHNNLGNVYRALGQLDLAIASYEKALAIQPDLHHALVHLVHQKQHICDWDGLDAQITQIRALVNKASPAQIPPFAFLAMPETTAQEQQQCASLYAQQQYARLTKQNLRFEHAKHTGRIKVGYLSADFRLHPLAYLISDLIAQHNRNDFEIYGYSYGADDQSPERQRLVQAFDHFIDIRPLNDIQAAQRIHADQIDLLVDLTGYTQSSRTGIVALKPAPISINWLGYPGTMGDFNGEPLFDYLLSDRVITPNNDYISECIRYLPCYQPNNPRNISQTTSRAQHELPDDCFVFCCFNQTFKITPVMFAIWMRLLSQVPNSVLWLLDCNPWAKANLQEQAKRAGIEPTRLIFAPRVSQAQHIERQRHADLFLDTLPYNAHTTASDALWMDLPILTCIGDTFPARVSASLLSSLGLNELICDALQSYEEKALQLARHLEQLQVIKQRLAANKASSILFQPQAFARELEDCYHAIWQQHSSNE